MRSPKNTEKATVGDAVANAKVNADVDAQVNAEIDAKTAAERQKAQLKERMRAEVAKELGIHGIEEGYLGGITNFQCGKLGAVMKRRLTDVLKNERVPKN